MRNQAVEQTYEFTLQVAGPDVTAEEVFEQLTEATHDRALFRRSGDLQFADFDIEATSFPEAVERAFDQLDGALPGLRVTRLEPEDLVTSSDIARRTGRSRQSVSLLIKGRRGPGSFPAPVAHVGSRSPLWSWAEVSRWFADSDREMSEEPLIAEFTAAVNAELEAREHQSRLRRVAEEQSAARNEGASPGDTATRAEEPTPQFALSGYMQRDLLPQR